MNCVIYLTQTGYYNSLNTSSFRYVRNTIAMCLILLTYQCWRRSVFWIKHFFGVWLLQLWLYELLLNTWFTCLWQLTKSTAASERSRACSHCMQFLQQCWPTPCQDIARRLIFSVMVVLDSIIAGLCQSLKVSSACYVHKGHSGLPTWRVYNPNV